MSDMGLSTCWMLGLYSRSKTVLFEDGQWSLCKIATTPNNFTIPLNSFPIILNSFILPVTCYTSNLLLFDSYCIFFYPFFKNFNLPFLPLLLNISLLKHLNSAKYMRKSSSRSPLIHNDLYPFGFKTLSFHRHLKGSWSAQVPPDRRA